MPPWISVGCLFAVVLVANNLGGDGLPCWPFERAAMCTHFRVTAFLLHAVGGVMALSCCCCQFASLLLPAPMEQPPECACVIGACGRGACFGGAYIVGPCVAGACVGGFCVAGACAPCCIHSPHTTHCSTARWQAGLGYGEVFFWLTQTTLLPWCSAANPCPDWPNSTRCCNNRSSMNSH